MASDARAPLVSVVMPVRHGADYLAQSIRSLLGQTLSHFELIIVDDKADAACRNILADHAAADPRIRILQARGRGIADALNQGIAQAKAPLLARMDADDVAHPTRLERQNDVLSAAPSISVLGSNYRPIDAEGCPGAEIVLPATPEAIRATLRHSNPLCHPSVMMRAAIVRASGGYRRALHGCEDFDLWLRLSEMHDLTNLQEPLLQYRRHDDQSTWQDLETRLLSEVAMYRSQRLRQLQLPDLALSDGPVTAGLLRDSGVSNRELRRSLRNRALEAATHALNAGERQRATQTLLLARRHGALLGRHAIRYARLMVKRAIA